MSDSPKYPYCIHCDAPVDRIDYSAKLETFEVKGGTVITYVKVSAYCRECGMELYVPEINDMNKLSRDNAYAAAMSRNGAKGCLAYRAGHYWGEDGTDYPDIYVYVNGYCSECGYLMCRAGATTIHYPDELMYTDKDWDYRKELIEAEDKLLEAATHRKVGITNFCPNCGAEMKEEKQDENDRSNNKN